MSAPRDSPQTGDHPLVQADNAAEAPPADPPIDPILLQQDAAQAATSQANAGEGHALEEGEGGFDQFTLDNLAALSRIGPGGEDGDGDGVEGFAELIHQDGEGAQTNEEKGDDSMSGERAEDDQMEGNATPTLAEPEGIREAGSRAQSVEDGSMLRREEEQREEDDRDDDAQRSDEGEGEDEGSGDGEYRDGRYVYENGRMKRKRNRTVLSCTECHRRKQQCDRNIPCKRCIKRGVASMCRMETTVLPVKKKRKPADTSTPTSLALSLRVHALETLIRSGSSLDPEAASTAAMETILHAQRAANQGSADAREALEQLGRGDVGGMTQEEQGGMLMDVLQQLSAASLGRIGEREEGDAANGQGGHDIWGSIPTAPPDNLTAISLAVTAPTAPTSSLNLTLPGFREDNNRPFIPPTVRYAEKTLRQESILAGDMLPIQGDEAFLDASLKFAYGPESGVYRSARISALHTSGLASALRIASSFLARYPSPFPSSSSSAAAAQIPGVPLRQVYVPHPTLDEDIRILREGGLEVKHYRFLDVRNGGVDFEGVKEDLQAAPIRSAVVLYVGGHIPTGTDFSGPQWRQVTTILQDRQLIPLVVMPFQGLSTGDPSKDAQPFRFMVHEGLPVALIQSFDAMMGLYAESPAILSVPTSTAAIKDKLDSVLRGIARSLGSSRSILGASVAKMILTDGKLHPAWLNEIKAMSDRLRSVREKLYDLLANKLKTPGSWAHIRRSAGMWCTTLLPPAQIISLSSSSHLHLLPPTGSLSLGTLNSTRIDHLARSLDATIRQALREAEEAAAEREAMELALSAARAAAAEEEERKRQEEEEAAQMEDQEMMERSIASAMEAQRRQEEEERRRDEENREMEEMVRKAAERAEIARQADAILASIQGH